ncbi:hypothetical protein DIPPA_10426 [Diplonema papillatum]|nr:hypothetical protein DIPPA_10426 [Diplonema papillatum]
MEGVHIAASAALVARVWYTGARGAFARELAVVAVACCYVLITKKVRAVLDGIDGVDTFGSEIFALGPAAVAFLSCCVIMSTGCTDQASFGDLTEEALEEVSLEEVPEEL